MIGKVTWGQDDRRYVATLEDDGTLNLTGPEGALVLELILRSKLTRYTEEYGPWRGDFGAEFLNDLAKTEGGKVEFAPHPPAPPGTIF